MDFRPWFDCAIHLREAGEESTRLPAQADAGHDFDIPAWQKPQFGTGRARGRRQSPRLIDLERRARFARLPLDPR